MIPSLVQPTTIDTHCCVRAVFYCIYCDTLHVPPAVLMADPTVRSCGEWSVPFVITSMVFQQFACYTCHQNVCGMWLAGLFRALE